MATDAQKDGTPDELWINVYEHDGEYAYSAHKTREDALGEDSHNVMTRAVRYTRADETSARKSEP